MKKGRFISDLETEDSRFSQSIEEKATHFAQTGALSDPSLSQLRDQIKKVMIPLLIKTFQFKLELTQSLSAPSRLQSQKSQRSPEEIVEHLKTLDNDLKVLLLWCQSCRSQIQKALTSPWDEQKSSVTTATPTSSHEAVSKSFNEAVTAHSSFFQHQNDSEKEPLRSADSSGSSTPKAWWKKFIGRS